MRLFIRLFGIALIATSLTACESMNKDKEVTVVQEPQQPVMTDEQLQSAYRDVLKNSGHSSVQVFSLDDYDMSAPYVPEQTAMLPAPRLPQGTGQPFGGNSHVTVFSLDDQIPAYNAGGYGPATPYGHGGIPPMIDGHMLPVPMGNGGADIYQDAISRIYFSHGGKAINAAGREVAGHVGQQCRGGGCGLVKVEGHASTRAEAKDEVQRRIINLKISMDRAMAVMRQLVRDGVPAGSIQVTAHGDRVPPTVVPGGDAEAASRRVEIITGSGH